MPPTQLENSKFQGCLQAPWHHINVLWYWIILLSLNIKYSSYMKWSVFWPCCILVWETSIHLTVMALQLYHRIHVHPYESCMERFCKLYSSDSSVFPCCILNTTLSDWIWGFPSYGLSQNLKYAMDYAV